MAKSVDTVVNEAKKTRERIDKILREREMEIEDTLANIRAYETEANEADDAMREATVAANLGAYDVAKAKRREAKTASEMYRARLDMINKRELISEEESDGVIDSLLAYEADLTAQYEKDIREPLALIEKLTDTYQSSIGEVERTIDRWTSDIHANYRTFGRTYYKETGSDRAPAPVPVHITGYKGSDVATIARDFISNVTTAKRG